MFYHHCALMGLQLRADELKREKHELDDPFGGAPAIDERYQQMKTVLENIKNLTVRGF